MSFTGKAVYTNTPVPELAEDLGDIVAVASLIETPLLEAIGDPLREATSIHHEWLEDELLPNRDKVLAASGPDETFLSVENGERFRTGDQIQAEGSEELMFVVSTHAASVVKVLRGYAGTTPESVKPGQVITILGNINTENTHYSRFVNRVRRGNRTQVFATTAEATGTDKVTAQIGIADELEFQKQEKLRGLLRELEYAVINSMDTERGKMRGIIPILSSNVTDADGAELTEEMVMVMLRQIWENSNSNVDLIVASGAQKRSLDRFYSIDTECRVYESDFGICRIVTTRHMPQDTVLLLDSSRIQVLPLAGRSFHFKPLASTGDYECGEIVGEYTLELKQEQAHGIIRGLKV